MRISRGNKQIQRFTHVREDVKIIKHSLASKCIPLSNPSNQPLFPNIHLLMKLRLNSSISHSINLQLKAQSRTLNSHLQRKVQIIKLNAPRGRQPRKQTPGDSVKICRESAHVFEISRVCCGCLIGVACYQVVCDNEGLARAEVTCVVECDGCKW